MTGYAEEELLGKNWFEMCIPERRRETVVDIFGRLFSGVIGDIRAAENLIVTKHGDERLISWHSTVVRDSDGTIAGTLSCGDDVTAERAIEAERERLIRQLQAALAEVKTLSGLLPICGHCKKVRDDQGYWHGVEVYVSSHTDARFSHGVCPDCVEKFYPWLRTFKADHIPDPGNPHP